MILQTGLCCTRIDYTSVDAGHVGFENYYKAYSGSVILAENVMSVHYYDFYITENHGHRHRIRGGINRPRNEIIDLAA